LSFPIIEGERFEPFALNELFDFNRYVVRKFFEDCRTAKDVADKVIKVVQYPFYLGQPTDKHDINWFHGKYCRTINDDYWSSASETALCGWGDCEDSSILTVGGMRLLGVAPEDVYEAFGVVRDASTGQVLGGHGWVYAKDSSFGTDKFVLVESTLDTPPGLYPEVGASLEDLKRPFKLGNVVYESEWLFNDRYFIVVAPGQQLPLGFTWRGRERKRFVESPRKYEAIAKAWGLPVKPLRRFRRSKLYRLRKALGL
jgi:hypothetical protein